MTDSTAMPLGPGQRGAAVRALQRELTELGARIGDPPGRYGADTEAAVRAFQRRRPWLTEDGVVTPPLRQALARALRHRQGERELAALAAARRPLSVEGLGHRPALLGALRRRLHGLGLHTGERGLGDEPDPELLRALRRFRRLAGLGPGGGTDLDPATAAALRATAWLPAVTAAWSPAAARRRFAAQARRVGSRDEKLAFLDLGAESSPWLETLAETSLPPAAARPRGVDGPIFRPYPRRGEAPSIDADGLPFLGPEIGQACVCLARGGAGGLEAAWLGREALAPVECLSSTKLVPMLNVLARLGRRLPGPPGEAVLRPWGSAGVSLELDRVLCDVVSYAGGVGSSNALAALLNQLEAEREAWIRGGTGGPAALRFGGRYGETPPIPHPQLRRRGDDAVLLPFGATAVAGNAVSVYDLTRLLSLLGWHRLLAPQQRLAGLTLAGARLAARALLGDPARYLDEAFASLGLARRVDAPLILSKMGYGESALVYSAFLHVRDRRDGRAVERSLALTLRCPKGPGEREAVRADLAMAEAVTTLLAHALEERR